MAPEDSPPSLGWLVRMLAALGEAGPAGRDGAPRAAGSGGGGTSSGLWDDGTTAADPRPPGPAAAPAAAPAETWPWLDDGDCQELLAAVAPPRAAPAPDDPMPAPSGHVGRFLVLGELGRGGFGVVYLAVDPELGRRVALKVARPERVRDEAQRRRFRHEAAAAARLDHPNVVTVYEAGRAGPFHYIAMAHVAGGLTLAHWARARPTPFTPRQAARLVLAVADAVRHAHAREVLHRDLKPTNILVRPAPAATPDDPGAVPLVCDFGLATPLGGGRDAAPDGARAGSPPYMAPEQVAGRPEAHAPTVDVYALGAILYELLAGRPPFQAGTRLRTLRQVIEERPVPPRRLRPDLPPDLEAVCLKCLEKRPDGRYPTAAALIADLERFLAGESTLARPAADD